MRGTVVMPSADARLHRRSLLLHGLSLSATASGLLAGPMCMGQETISDADLMTNQVERAIRSGLDYLTDRQNPNGSFGPGGYGHNAAVVALTGMAMLARGSTPDRGRYAFPLSRCIDYTLQNARPSGFIETPGGSMDRPMYGHGFATLFLAEAYGTGIHAELRAALSRAVELIINTQNAEGGWRYQPRRQEADISVTICQVMALRAARNAGIHVPNATIQLSVEFIKRCQNPDGGFMYMLSQPGDSRYPRSAAAIVALYSAGIYEGPIVEAGLAYLDEHAGDIQNFDIQSHYFYALYYAAQAMWHAGGVRWTSWYLRVRKQLLQLQRSDGSWSDAIGSEYATSMACLVLMTPRNFLPIFQR